MKWKPWLPLLLLGALATQTPRLIALITDPQQLGAVPQAGESEPTSANICQKQRPAVVTLYAGTEFGSGSLITPDGLVLTNHHVVQEVQQGPVRVKLWNGPIYLGRVVATAPREDLALVQVTNAGNQRFPTIQLAAAEGQADEPVCAIGSPFNRPGVIAKGLLTGRRQNGDLKLSLLLHPGNSGGPLLNSEGHLIGVNKAIWESDTGENTGISFATNLADTRQFLQAHQATTAQGRSYPRWARRPIPSAGEAPLSDLTDDPVDFDLNPTNPQTPDAAPNREGARLGVLLNPRTLIIQVVEPNSAAEKAGLTAGDRLLAVDGQTLTSFEALKTHLARQPRDVTVTFRRHSRDRTITVTF